MPKHTPFNFTGDKAFPFFLGTLPVKFSHLAEADTGPEGTWTPKLTLQAVLTEEQKESLEAAFESPEWEAQVNAYVEREKSPGNKRKMRQGGIPKPRITEDLKYEGEDDDKELVATGYHCIKLSISTAAIEKYPKTMPQLFDSNKRPISPLEEIPSGSLVSIYCRPRITFKDTLGVELQPTHMCIIERASESDESSPFGPPDEETEEDYEEEEDTGDEPAF